MTNTLAPNANNRPPANSILTVDFGNTHTRANLIDLVEGVYTIVAQATENTTAGFPAGDISLGLARALRQLGTLTGRRLAENDGRVITPERNEGLGMAALGVDLFIATASIGRPLRAVLVGLMGAISIASGQRAAAGTYVDIADVIALDDGRTREDQLNAILLARPDLIFLVGGTEDGTGGPVREMAQLAAAAVRLMPPGIKPLVLYAGNPLARGEAEALFTPETTLFIADNVRPSLEREQVSSAQLQLARAFNAQATRRGAGFERIAGMTQTGVQPSASSYDTVARYLADAENTRRAGRRGRRSRAASTALDSVLIADVGSATSTLSLSLGGETTTAIRTDLGQGSSAAAALEAVGAEAVRAWLPFEADDDQIANYALNKTARPAYVPQDRRELYSEHAFLRAMLAELLNTARPSASPSATSSRQFRHIIGAGATLCGTGRPGLAAMLLLDAFQPVGITRLQLDEQAVIPALGALSRVQPEAVVQLLEGQSLQTLGIAFSLGGRVRAGSTAARVRITPADVRPGKASERFTIPGGSLWVYPLPLGVRATVEITAARGLTFGSGRQVRMVVEGGTAGVIIDARGRPLPLAATTAGRAEQIPAWYSQATGDPVHTVPAGWLERRERPVKVVSLGAADVDPFSSPDATPIAETGKRRRGRRGKGQPEPAPVLDEGALLDDALSAFDLPTDPPRSSGGPDMRSRLGNASGGAGERLRRGKKREPNPDDEFFREI